MLLPDLLHDFDQHVPEHHDLDEHGLVLQHYLNLHHIDHRVDLSKVWECDPTGALPAERRAAMGTFPHEAVAFDRKRRVYLTEDQSDGRLYRFTPFDRRSVATGTLEVAADLLVAEDGGNMELVMITPDGIAAPLLRITGRTGSGIAGPAFDPSGRRLYVSSQRGAGSRITYEITGPFRRRAG